MSELSRQGFLTECEREQLHHAQAIQPNGALLGGMPGDSRLRFASVNLADWIGYPAEAALGRSLVELLPDFPPPTDIPADAWMHPSTGKRLYPNLCSGPRGSLDGLLSCNGRNWLLELETALPASQQREVCRPVTHRLYRMPYTETDWTGYCQYLADELRVASGFERVMIYRFRDDGCGEVISESLIDGLAPYLGLRYPASDIPQIARQIYLSNRHRQIADIAAVPVPILADQGVLADLTLSDLRAVSPVHLDYLKNMGVTASLSFSLVLKERLWGLIACHHRLPRALPLPVRERCADLAQVFTLAISGYQSTRSLLDIGQSDDAIARLIDALHQTDIRRRRGMGHAEDTDPMLGEALLAMVGATGAALVEDRSIVSFGITPDRAAIRAQVDWLQRQVSDPIFATHALSLVFPPAAACADRASGLLAVRVGRFAETNERAFLWWRPEQPQSVYWAGDPRKTNLFDPQRQILSPRSSFERWIETSSSHSEPWSNTDLLCARKFRSLVLHDIYAEILRR